MPKNLPLDGHVYVGRERITLNSQGSFSKLTRFSSSGIAPQGLRNIPVRLCNSAGFKQVASGELKLATAKSKSSAKVRKGAAGKTAKGKTAVKKAPKTVAKKVKKPVTKATVKKVVKKVVKKAAAKVVKTAAKVVKRTAKPAPKAAKHVAKPASKAAKQVAKPAPKAAKHVAKPAAKAPAQVFVKHIPQQTAKQVSKPLPPEPVITTAKPSTVKIGNLLSEAEVVKQAKTDYMSRQQLAFFKHRLLALQTELRDNAESTTEHLRELAVAPDPADRATLEEEHALELRTRDRERKLLKKVQSALMRIEDGSYGYCEETGEPIGVQRLLARPTATLTIEAQERREMKQKMYGE